MASIDRVRIMVLGDSGVGKTSFVHLAANGEPIKSPSWTIGCSIEVKLHEYKEGTRDQTTFFVEFWDVGGSKNHQNTRPVFYNPCHGVILVHDLTNRKSEANLQRWLKELLTHDKFNEGNSALKGQSDECMDAENVAGLSNLMPILVVGTRLDQADERRSNISNTSFRYKYNVEEILLNCRQARYIAAGSSNAVKLSRFYDKVIENRQKVKHRSFTERFGSNAKSPVFSPKFFPSHQD